MARRASTRQTITAVSKAAGVSIATVSRVINGHRHVADATVESVRAAMRDLGYAPRDPSSRQPGSAAGRTGNVAVFFTDVNQEALRTPLSGRLLHGIGEMLRAQGLTMVVTGLPDGRSAAPACIDQRKVDGVIIRGSRMSCGELEEMLKLVPCVWVFEAGYRAAFDVDMILEDNPAIGSMAANWLVGRGHRHLAVLDPMPEHPSLRVRRLFFCDVGEHLGATVTPYVAAADGDGLAAQVERLLAAPRRPTGLFIPGNDRDVVEAYRALHARGLSPGRDFDLISCNNDPHRLSALDPRLPNIDIRPEVIGRAAVDTMIWRLKNPAEERRRMLIAPQLVPGVDAPAARGAEDVHATPAV